MARLTPAATGGAGSVGVARKKRGAGKFARASFPYALKLFRGVIVFCRGSELIAFLQSARS
jgi:hypothetical protein